jgi:4Fe-4S ferredoxin
MNPDLSLLKPGPTQATQHCKQEKGQFMPVIDPNRCEGKGPCIDACPVDVLAMGQLPKRERKNLSFKGAIKAFVHRYEQARVVNLAACLGCADCVKVCPEQAITLGRQSAPETRDHHVLV